MNDPVPHDDLPTDAPSSEPSQGDPGTASVSKVRMVEAIADGTVIDHIPPAATLKVAALVARAGDPVFIGINLRSRRVGRKGLLKIANRELTDRELACLGLIAPGASVAIIRNYEVAEKWDARLPDELEGIARCANPNCVTNHERWTTSFRVVRREPTRVRCRYCERLFATEELALVV